MRVAGHTYAFRQLPLGEALDELRGLGLDTVEVWLGHARDTPKEAAEALAARGLVAAAVSAGGFYEPGDPTAPRAFALAEAVGARVVVACVSPELLDEVAALVPPGISLCLENHWDQPLDGPGAVSGALAAHPSLRACVDTGHSILAGVPPERFVGALGPRVGHVHLKDAAAPSLPVRALGRRARRRLLERPRPVFPGTGSLSVPRLRTALAAAGYDGVVTVEHEGDDPGAALQALLAQWRDAV